MILENKRIFIVEDNPGNIVVMLKILTKHGASVQIDWWARGEVNRVLKALPLDLILLDLMLPGGHSGFAVFDEIQTYMRMGKFTAAEYYDVHPDMLAFGNLQYGKGIV